MNRLNAPWGVCVSGQYVYVSNHWGHDVSAFTTAGHYVTSFGKDGREKGGFNGPRGICIDQHDIVYVCDFCNN